MKVKELIDLLLSENPDKKVVVDGYEEGFDELEAIKNISILPNSHKQQNPKKYWWIGDFKESFSEGNGESVILLPRKKRSDYV